MPGTTFSNPDYPDQIRNVECSDDELIVSLADGRRIAVPLWWYPRLYNADPKDRANFEIGRFGIHWDNLDEDIELAGILNGAKAPDASEPIDA